MLILEFTEDHSFVIRKCFEDEADEFLDPGNNDAKWEFSINTAKVISKHEKASILSELIRPLAKSILQHDGKPCGNPGKLVITRKRWG